MQGGPPQWAAGSCALSTEQRLKQITGFATRLARRQTDEAELNFKPLIEGDDEMLSLVWATYIGHVAGRLSGLLGHGRAHAIIQELLSTYEKHRHDN